MSKCSGCDLAWYEAEPNWFEQADDQMYALLLTLQEINDDSVLEAWDVLEGKIAQAKISGVLSDE